jgi:hypothetical protein
LTGKFRSNVEGSLDIWHCADELTGLPTLSPEWLAQSKEPLDRCLAVSSSVHPQFYGWFYYDLTMTRCMPPRSIPGLANHF